MQVLALYNVKGGVGKTASAVNLAYCSTLTGARSLVWDLDPQGASSFYFRVKTEASQGGRKLEKKKQLRLRVRATDFEGLDVVPADFSYRHLDLALEAAGGSGRLRSLVKPFRHDYEYLFLDCPPSISLTSESVFAVADALVVPTIPTPLALRTLEQLAGHLAALDVEPRLLPFFCMVDRRKRLHREICEPTRSRFPMLSTHIPYSSHVEQMGLYRQPVSLYAPRSTGASSYKALWDEIVARLAGGGQALARDLHC